MDSQQSEEMLNDIFERHCKRDFSYLADIFRAGIDDCSVLRQAERREEAARRAEQAWSYQAPKTVPLTWVDMTVWLLNKLGIRSKRDV